MIIRCRTTTKNNLAGVQTRWIQLSKSGNKKCSESLKGSLLPTMPVLNADISIYLSLGIYANQFIVDRKQTTHSPQHHLLIV